MRSIMFFGQVLIGSCLLLTSIAGAQAPAPAPPPAKPAPAPSPDQVMANRIVERLKQGDAAAQQEAITEIRSLLQSQPQKAAGQLRGSWLKLLLDAQRNQEVVELTQPTLVALAGDTAGVEQVLSFRVQALLALEKNAEALSAAKQLFNFAGMKGTANSVLTVCQCLNAVHPDDRDILKRFRQEQVEGARPTATNAPHPKSDSLLAGVAIDPKPYEAALRALTGEDYKTLVTRGNLLLLAGRNDEAWDVLERAYSQATDKDLPVASENLARCMKAQDGAIGRANAFIASIRPKPQAASLQDLQLDAVPATQPQVRSQP